MIYISLISCDSFNYVENLSVFLHIKVVTSHALLWKFFKIQILVVERLKLIACLMISPNFRTPKRGVLTHKHAPKRVCKFQFDHLVASGAIFGEFFFRGMPPAGPRNPRIYMNFTHFFGILFGIK